MGDEALVNMRDTRWWTHALANGYKLRLKLSTPVIITYATATIYEYIEIPFPLNTSLAVLCRMNIPVTVGVIKKMIAESDGLQDGE